MTMKILVLCVLKSQKQVPFRESTVTRFVTSVEPNLQKTQDQEKQTQ